MTLTEAVMASTAAVTLTAPAAVRWMAAENEATEAMNVAREVARRRDGNRGISRADDRGNESGCISVGHGGRC